MGNKGKWAPSSATSLPLEPMGRFSGGEIKRQNPSGKGFGGSGSASEHGRPSTVGQRTSGGGGLDRNGNHNPDVNNTKRSR